MPYIVILNPRYSSSFLAKKDFFTFTLKPFGFNLLSTLSNLFILSSQDLLLIIKSSSIYVLRTISSFFLEMYLGYYIVPWVVSDIHICTKEILLCT